MKIRLTSVVIIVIALSAAVLLAQDKVYVASIASNDLVSSTHIENLLKLRGIESWIGGSIEYDICVAKGHEAKASAILHEDAKTGGYWIRFGEAEIHERAIENRPERRIRLPVKELLASDEFGADKPLGRFLRSKELAQKLKEFPFVESLSIRERRYYATQAHMETAYEIEIVLRASADAASDGVKTGYQVWDQGRGVVGQGGGPWSNSKRKESATGRVGAVEKQKETKRLSEAPTKADKE